MAVKTNLSDFGGVPCAGAPWTPPDGPRDAEDDFYCVRYALWYPSIDCALRTRFRTAPGCLHCDQGRFNLKRHAARIARTRWAFRAASGD